MARALTVTMVEVDTKVMDPGESGRRLTPASTEHGSSDAAAQLFADARILIVDDQESNVILLDRLLRTAGARHLFRLTDPRETVAHCLELRPDLVLLDLHMPHLDGVAVLQQLQAALDPDVYLPVLVLTADTTDVAKVRALDAGAKDFLTKPLDRSDVLLRVRNHLETSVLYKLVQGENQRLKDELRRREAASRAAEEQRQRKRDRIQHVLDHDSIEMVFQPVADLVSGTIRGVEALARFRSADDRTPDVWFAEAADVGLGVELEMAAVEAAMRRIPDLPPGVLMAVNASPSTAMSDAFSTCIRRCPTPERVVIELTEHVPIDDYDLLVGMLDEHRRAGARVAVDDAGAGYAGLHHIVHLRPDVLKLDRELTVAIEDDPAKRAMAASMVHFASEIDAILVAEGIETQAALDCLIDLGVTHGQGYHLARPGLLPLDSDRLDVGAGTRRTEP
jgi:EAL domain-containing protein (putative c-di-GMP-specific phosphodiesterase class I)/FixJ family two-component response regulator